MIDFTVRPDGEEPYTLTCGSRDILVWEKTNKGKSFNGLMNDLHISDMYQIAFQAARRQKLFAGNLTEFETSVELDMKETDEEADPSRKAR